MTDRRTFLASIGAAGTALVAGCGGGGDDPDDETVAISNGTRVRAPLAGLRTSDLDLGERESDALATAVAETLDIDRFDVRVREESATIEVFSEDVDAAGFATALQATGIDVEAADISAGVTDETRDTATEVLRGRLDRMGLSGGEVFATDDGLVVVAIPDTAPERAREIVTDRGTVRIVAEVTDPESETTTTTTVLTGEDIAAVSEIGQRQGGWEVPVTVTDKAAQRFQNQLNELGFTGEDGIGNCDRTRSGGSGSYCLLTKSEGHVVRANSMGRGLAESLAEGTWADQAAFTIGAENAEQAEEIKRNLEVGSLPTTLDLDASSAEITRIGA